MLSIPCRKYNFKFFNLLSVNSTWSERLEHAWLEIDLLTSFWWIGRFLQWNVAQFRYWIRMMFNARVKCLKMIWLKIKHVLKRQCKIYIPYEQVLTTVWISCVALYHFSWLVLTNQRQLTIRKLPNILLKTCIQPKQLIHTVVNESYVFLFLILIEFGHVFERWVSNDSSGCCNVQPCLANGANGLTLIFCWDCIRYCRWAIGSNNLFTLERHLFSTCSNPVN